MNALRRSTIAWLLLGSLLAGQAPRTRAERTEFRETSRHADVMRFLAAVTAGSDRLELTRLGRSTEDREIPCVIVAPPALRHPARAHAAGRLVVYIQANIHAGEVDGKEALLVLLRELAAGEHEAMQEQLVLLVVPLYNPDGNERVSTRHRPGQAGPAAGVGQRPNAQNLDLNRDYMKLDAPETRASLALINRWDPHLLMDLHTTDGCQHRYALTYASSHHPNADRPVQDFLDRVLLPEVQKALRPDYEVFYYGNFIDRRDPAKGWGTFGWQGRYASNYHGLRNRFSLLAEAYAYRDFRTRIDVQRRFVTEVLRAAVRHRAKMLALAREADRRITAGAWRTMGVDFERVAWPKTYRLLGYEMTPESLRRRRPAPGDRPKDYVGPIFYAFRATETVAVPAGYLFPRALRAVAAHLERHGVRVYRLLQGGEVDVEVSRLEKLNRSERLYQGRTLQHAEVTVSRRAVAFAPGDFWVPVRQPLGRLAAELLEPRGRDGLLAWGFLDRFLARRSRRAPVVIPIHRAVDPLELPVHRHGRNRP